MDNGLTGPGCGLLTAVSAQSLTDSVDAFLFDCDGVIWKGDKLIEGVPETMELLRKMGKKLVFVTNNSRKSRRQYSKKFRALGLEVSEEEIFTSSFAAAMFLKLNNFPPEKKVYVVGEDGILEELKLAGFVCLGGPEDGNKNIILEADFCFEHDKNVGAVIVGLDQYFNYYKMQYQFIKRRQHPLPTSHRPTPPVDIPTSRSGAIFLPFRQPEIEFLKSANSDGEAALHGCDMDLPLRSMMVRLLCMAVTWIYRCGAGIERRQQ